MRILVAGIGNVFLGDDGFGAAVAQRLAGRRLPREVELADFGIRGVDLAYALSRSYDAAILVDAMAHGESPGHLQVIEPDFDAGAVTPFDSHRMDPLTVLRLARRLGRLPPQIFLVGCEPAAAQDESMSMALSGPVASAVDKAAELVLGLADRLLAGRQPAANDHMNAATTGRKEC